MHKLIIEDDEGKAVVVPLIRDEISIGRKEGNTIRLTERNVSRRHARLVRREGRYVLEDLSSYIGTKVNGAKITGTVSLNDGDQVGIGDYRLAIRVDRPGTVVGLPAAAPIVATAPATAALPGPAAATAAAAAVAAVAAMPAPVPGVSAPPEPMDSAPTIPVRMLAEQGIVPTTTLETPVAAMPPARLVVMTQPLSGQEFILDRASLVIGRTQENDIVLNHKSISRHHAKVIRDGDRYVVVDLESANGVRVNGAEYERVELQSGDVVELGHMRMRFATADDPSVFDRDSFRFGGVRNKKLLIGVGAAVVGTAALVLALTSDDGRESRSTGTAQTSTPAAPSGLTDSAATLLQHAKDAYRAQKWADALVLVARAAAIAPGLPEAEELRHSIEAEQQNASRLEVLQKAIDTKDYASSLNGAAVISDGSVYKARARTLEHEGRGKLIAQHLANAEKRRAEGNCTEARRHAELVLTLETDNQPAQDVLARCTRIANVTRAPPPAPAIKPPAAAARTSPPLAARPTPRTASSGGPTSRTASSTSPPPRTEEAGAPAAAGDADDLLQQAQNAWLKGQFAAAIDASRRALRVRPGLTRAYQIIAVCSCSLRDAEQATRAYERLDDRNRQLVKQACQKSGVNIE
jgi:pSer/pThr/pTyr-binding forkhead associated (FHA) protein/tetratricopeptide (TPR) repeat protein